MDIAHHQTDVRLFFCVRIIIDVNNGLDLSRDKD